jgi:alpha-glucoside transport system permease protein
VADAVLAALWGIPALTLVATALRPPADAATSGWWTGSFGLGSFEVVLERWRFAASLVDTAGLAATVALLVVALGLAAAYALAWLAPPQARTGGVVLLVLSAVVPVQVVAAPISQVLDGLGLAVGPAGFVLVHVALGLPFAVLVLREELERVNWDPGRGGTGTWVQQARLEGARERDVAAALLRRIRPAIVAIAVLEVVQVWNDLAVSLFFQPAQLSPLGSLVFGQTREFTQASGPLAASALLMAAVPVTLVVVTRRSLVTFLREVLR